MEQRAAYGPWRERPRLTVVQDGGASYSALPHAVLFSDLTDGAIRLYAVLQSHWWGDSGECSASHITLATEARCALRSLRRYLNELIAAELIEEVPAGVRREKSYRPIPIGQKGRIETVNEAEMADCEPVNRPKTTVQSAKNDTGNRTKGSHSYKKTPVKKTIEEELPPSVVGDASAPQPATEKPKAVKFRGTRCPETFELEAKHLAYAETLGFTPSQARAETDKFLAHHRFKGTVGVDWYAGWQNWLRKALTFAAQSPQARNGTAQVPPGAAKHQRSDWSKRNGRYGHGTNATATDASDGR